MDARQEAYERLGGRYEVRVLEPSPPAVREPPWFADDPVARGSVPAGRMLIAPVAGGDLTWDALCREERDPALAAWCAERWLAAWLRLPAAPPPRLAETRLALHTVAEHVLAPARHAANGKIGLRWASGGFGTPFYGDDRQLRIDQGDLVIQDLAGEVRLPLTTLELAARSAGVQPGAPAAVYRPSTPLDPGALLPVDPAAAAFLGSWFGFCTSVLEELRAAAGPEEAPSRVQLWPEHFDLSLEVGAEHRGARAAYGGSPGDEAHPEPYLYVAPWSAPPEHPFWAEPHFRGASLAYRELAAAADQRADALDFLRSARHLLRSR